jgi:ASC-1-like (ASCH) protein
MINFFKTHTIKVKDEYYPLFASGKKSLVFMLCNRKGKRIKINDYFIVKNRRKKCKFLVKNIYKDASFEKLFKYVDVSKSGFKNEDEVLKNLKKVFPKEKIKKFSAMAVEICFFNK